MEVSNPFSHPRQLIGNFTKAEKVLLHGIRVVHNAKFPAPRPLIVIHPMDKLDGGLTDVECRVFRELALAARARELHLHVGKELDIDHFSLDQVCAPDTV